MRTIWKYSFDLNDFDPALIDMKAGANIIHVEQRHVNAANASRVDSFTIWAEVDTSNKDVSNLFAIRSTGGPFSLNEWEEHIATWLDGVFVWHLYRTEAAQ